jgi:hypothetical protein
VIYFRWLLIQVDIRYFITLGTSVLQDFSHVAALVFAIAIAQAVAHAVNASEATAYGVICDGRTDNAAAIQAAVNSSRGSTLRFVTLTTETCLLSRAVTIPSDTKIEAPPGMVVLRPAADNTGSPALLSVIGSKNVLVYGLTFDGAGQDFPNSSPIIVISHCQNVVFDRVTWQHGRGLALVASTHVVASGVRNSTFVDIGNRWKTTRKQTDRKQGVGFCCGSATLSFDNFVINFQFDDIGLDAVSVTENTGFRVVDNSFHMANGQHSIRWSSPVSPDFGAAIYGANERSTANFE